MYMYWFFSLKTEITNAHHLSKPLIYAILTINWLIKCPKPVHSSSFLVVSEIWYTTHVIIVQILSLTVCKSVTIKSYGFINPTRPPSANPWWLPCESPYMCPISQWVDWPLPQLVGRVLAYSLLLHDKPIRWAELCKPEHRQLHIRGDINHRGQGKGWDSDWSVSQVLTRKCNFLDWQVSNYSHILCASASLAIEKIYAQAQLKNQFQLPWIHLRLQYKCMYMYIIWIELKLSKHYYQGVIHTLHTIYTSPTSSWCR